MDVHFVYIQWGALMSVLKKRQYTPPPLASFVSHQLHKYLISVNPDNNEVRLTSNISS
jgi:hypothetical protein